MKRISTALALTAATFLLSATAGAQSHNHPTLHVSTRWKDCSFQLHPSLTTSAWKQFTREAAQVVYFRPLADARPMGRGNFELSLMQWQTNIDDHSSAWNDTFVHPDSTHWLYEGSGLKFPGLSLRAGVGSRTDVGVYFTKNPNANYGVYGVQLQQNLLAGAHDWDVSARASFVSLFGPEDVALNVYGVDLVASWKQFRIGSARITPYAAGSAFLSTSHEKSDVVALDDEHVMSAMGTVGATLQVSVLRLGAEASIASVPSFALKLGFGR